MVRVHPDLCKSVRGHATPADREQTRAVLELMGGKTSDVCNLENADAISCVMHVFFRALGSQERSRGLFVVWVSSSNVSKISPQQPNLIFSELNQGAHQMVCGSFEGE